MSYESNLSDNWFDYMTDCRFCGKRHHVTDVCAKEPARKADPDECEAPEPVEPEGCREVEVGFGAVEAF